MKKIFNFLLFVIIDMIAIYASLFAALIIYKLFAAYITQIGNITYQSIFQLYWIPLIYIFTFAVEGFYTSRIPFWEEAKHFLKTITIVMVLVFAIVSFFHLEYNISRLYILILWIVSLAFIPLFRYYGRKILYRYGIWNEPVMILGITEEGKMIADNLSKNTYLGYQVVGFISYDKEFEETEIKTHESAYPNLGKYTDIQNIATSYSVQVVVIALSDFEADRLSKILNHLQQMSRRVLLLPKKEGGLLYNTKLLHLFSRQMFIIEVNNNLKKLLNIWMKKAFDYALAILIFPFLVPVLGGIAFLIKRDSEGPVFFIQDRLGKHDRNFKCIKFRTMYENGDEILAKYFQEHPEAKEEYQKYKKLKDYDPRVTKVGRFLRKASLDELAQIFNVLRGEMSFVGPRPYLPSEREDIGADRVEIILEAAPGITGLWQISGRNDLAFEERVKLDVWYVLNWSLWTDIAILIKTAKVVLKREGAY